MEFHPVRVFMIKDIYQPYTRLIVTKTFKFKVGNKTVNTTTEEKVPEKDSTQIKTQK